MPSPHLPFQPQLDPFTGLGNILAFLNALDTALARAIEGRRSLAVLLFDLDRFAELNDQHGRQWGDEAIVRVAAALRGVATSLRGDDVGGPSPTAFRLQGDEFALVVPLASSPEAAAIATAVLDSPELAGLSLSIGIGVAVPDAADLGRVLLSADHALHAAKRRGGGQAVRNEGEPIDGERACELVGWLARQLLGTGRQLEAAYQLALTDPVTALPNQRALYRFLDTEVPRAIRHAHPFSLLMVDGDNLKTFNEQLGYAAGDEWIKILGAVLVRETRASDLVVRWRSGDEFIVALPETTRDAACLTAERIRAAVEDLAGHLPLPVTVSIGVATFPDDGGAVDDLLTRVEAANGRAKSAGKNRVAVFDGAKA